MFLFADIIECGMIANRDSFSNAPGKLENYLAITKEKWQHSNTNRNTKDICNRNNGVSQFTAIVYQ